MDNGQTFWAKNNHKNYIFLKLEIDSNIPDLDRSYQKSHVIGLGEFQDLQLIISILSKLKF